MIKEWIEEYNPQNEEQILSALREIMQEITLAALSRTDFFEKAAFYGGTALRIFYGLNRYSEDLDFSLLKPDSNFSIEPYFKVILDEFKSLGLTVSIKEKKKTKQTAIDSAFLKTETIWQEIVLEDIIKETGVRSNKTLKIKIEVDRQPPLNFQTEEKLLLRPFSFYVKCFAKPSLFAGKMHALLFRRWKNRVKGRDWYDLEWYIKKGIPLDVYHFLARAKDTDDWQGNSITNEQIIELLDAKIKSVSFKSIKEDVFRFIEDEEVLSIWRPEYFKDLINKMKFENT
ncbi:nucleotidyl transferase AbiEii/AbiGii toxin family protein [Winogradskyella immobilis]|uniref:Nucleotidyl transferase AbiEii/AbiGii toxin family protein n=1 Tax=Winogradskyella immobilis TaxID=2816852 RepID=A0ABS8EQZ1_9FLAO|nr:nucleotidyl transferase AbiEii/AbiGii toxin family protein [Winogradskyella immobilis]MCC1485659.1 nucleotidyl transferase AbiEii/AbiGii toxin family protein [Winogradskyella immobilis]MCG0017752.1 nucleotidyl transferase AbiEii/AbiGii toxin family protein [Winogradskyella immobilis]